MQMKLGLDQKVPSARAAAAVLKWRKQLRAQGQGHMRMAQPGPRTDPQIAVQNLASAVFVGHVEKVLIVGAMLPDFRSHFDSLHDDDDAIV
jgi:hypothetical protein